MNRNRTVQCLLFMTVLLAINLVTMLLRNPAPAQAQEKRAPLKYEIVSGIIGGDFTNRLNTEVASGWHVKFYAVTDVPGNVNHCVLLEK